jgi:hypothetical protein
MKPFFRGGRAGPAYFQFPVHYGNFAPPDRWSRTSHPVGAPI